MPHSAHFILRVSNDIINFCIPHLLLQGPVPILRLPIDSLYLKHLFLHNIYWLSLFPSRLSLLRLEFILALACPGEVSIGIQHSAVRNQASWLMNSSVFVVGSLLTEGFLFTVSVSFKVIIGLLSEQPLDKLVFNLLLADASKLSNMRQRGSFECKWCSFLPL